MLGPDEFTALSEELEERVLALPTGKITSPWTGIKTPDDISMNR